MINPLLTVNFFKIRTKKAVVRTSYTANVYSNQGSNPMGAALLDMITNMGQHGDKGYISFTSYKRNHQKEDVEYCSAVMLEYPYRDRAALLERLESFPFVHYLIDTQSDFDGANEARVLLAIPLAQPITMPKLYTRVASLLWDELGIEAHTKGDISSTFLFAAYTINPSVVLYDDQRTFLDATEYLAANRGNWVVATEGSTPTAKPKPISANGLWEGLE